MSGTTVRFPKLGQLLRSRRLGIGATLEQVAVAIGSTKSHVWDLEQGRCEPKAGCLFRLCHVLDISFTEIKPCFPWKALR